MQPEYQADVYVCSDGTVQIEADPSQCPAGSESGGTGGGTAGGGGYCVVEVPLDDYGNPMYDSKGNLIALDTLYCVGG